MSSAAGLDSCTHFVFSFVWTKHPVLTNHISWQQPARRAPVLTVQYLQGLDLTLCQYSVSFSWSVFMPNITKTQIYRHEGLKGGCCKCLLFTVMRTTTLVSLISWQVQYIPTVMSYHSRKTYWAYECTVEMWMMWQEWFENVIISIKYS